MLMKKARTFDGEASPMPVLALFAALFLVSMVPIWHALLPPLADYPNHLARIYILMNLETSALLQRYYENVLSAQPNLAMDLLVPLLARLVPLETAGKLFMGLTFLSMAGGVLALHHVLFRRWSLWPCLAFLFLYNRMFLWGFLGYLFSLGVTLFGIAAWIGLRDRPDWLRLAAGSAFAVALYLGHLYAFGIYALALGGFELTRFIVARRAGRGGAFSLADAAVLGAQFMLPLYLFVFVSPTAQAIGATYWGSFWRKAEAPFNVVNTYNLALDMLTLAAVGGLVGFGVLTRRVAVAWAMSGAMVLLLLAFLAMPDKLLSSYGADQRLPIALALLAVACTDGRLRPAAWRWGVAVAALFVLRIGVIGAVWDRSNQVYAEYLAAIDRLPEGSRLMPVIAMPGRSLPPIPVFEIANLAIIGKQAFVPSLFAYPLHAAETVSFTPDYRALAAATPLHIVWPNMLARLADPDFARTSGFFRPELLGRYDYVLVADEAALPEPVPAALETVFAGTGFRLLRVPYALQASQ